MRHQITLLCRHFQIQSARWASDRARAQDGVWNASARTVPKESRGAMAQCDDGMNTLAQIIHESLRDATVPSSVSPGSGCFLCLVELSEQRLDRLLQLTHACLGDLLAV